ncbi:MAG TPA: cytochrome c oxidase assembly protein [Burkholderiales bacterium]|nr:cytochrome c oxidase assembly protein [Burkholderiales bacterium]
MIGVARAHDGIFHAPGEITVWSAWTLDPLTLGLLGLSGFLYWRGARRTGTREALFAAGMAGLFLALVWPLDALGERLFSAHMAQHLVLMNVAAPLLVLGSPLSAMLRALPLAWRRPAARLVPRPGLVAATLLQLLVLWAWHVPSTLALALESDTLHITMHATLLAAALYFWTAVLRPREARYWAPIAALLLTLKVTGMVCIVLLLQPGSLYPVYGDAADQQIGWGIMMIIGTASYLGAAVALAAAWLARLEATQPSTR